MILQFTVIPAQGCRLWTIRRHRSCQIRSTPRTRVTTLNNSESEPDYLDNRNRAHDPKHRGIETLGGIEETGRTSLIDSQVNRLRRALVRGDPNVKDGLCFACRNCEVCRGVRGESLHLEDK